MRVEMKKILEPTPLTEAARESRKESQDRINVQMSIIAVTVIFLTRRLRRRLAAADLETSAQW
jgi:hypothetical protein